MDHKIQISGKQLTRNWGLNLLGQLVPLGVALVAMPFIVRGLGPERFGVLSIVWAVLGSLSLLDFGLGRSTTKFIAECIGRGDVENFPCVFWTSLWSQLLIGIAGTIFMAALVPYCVDHYLRLSVVNVQETKSSFLILVASIPIVLGGNSIRGVLEAVQRFDVVNYVRIPTMMGVFILPLIALAFGLRLPAIVFLLVLSRLVAALAYLTVCMRLFPSVRRSCSLHRELLHPLLAYGGWVSISNFVAPLLTYSDRFVIGSVIGMSYVSYYTAPNEAVTKAAVLPGSLLTTLFPALATLDASGNRERVQELCSRALQVLLLLMTPSLLMVVVFARQILQLWLGSDFAAHSATALQIFCLGVMVNSLAFVPFFLLQGLGRPDITAKIHILELPIYGIALIVLLPKMGLAGAALAWSFRLLIDACLLFGAASLLKMLSLRALLDNSTRRAFALLCGLGGALVLPFYASQRLSTHLLLAATALFIFVWAVWKYVVKVKDKDMLMSHFRVLSFRGRSLLL